MQLRVGLHGPPWAHHEVTIGGRRRRSGGSARGGTCTTWLATQPARHSPHLRRSVMPLLCAAPHRCSVPLCGWRKPSRRSVHPPCAVLNEAPTKVVEVSSGGQRRAVDLRSGGSGAAAPVAAEANETGPLASLRAFFLPRGWPHSVTPDYLTFQLATVPAHVTGWCSHSLATSSMIAVRVVAGWVGWAGGLADAPPAACFASLYPAGAACTAGGAAPGPGLRRSAATARRRPPTPALAPPSTASVRAGAGDERGPRCHCGHLSSHQVDHKGWPGSRGAAHRGRKPGAGCASSGICKHSHAAPAWCCAGCGPQHSRDAGEPRSLALPASARHASPPHNRAPYLLPAHLPCCRLACPHPTHIHSL